ncbi:MAG: hypothetical protein VKN72_01910 [Nostocales cyanobacterium 94392]|nr:hypothetical protein [Nostocales cyanobacterium 94392]
MVRDTKNLIIPLKINQSVTAPYGQNVPVAAIPIIVRELIALKTRVYKLKLFVEFTLRDCQIKNIHFRLGSASRKARYYKSAFRYVFVDTLR